MAGLPSRDLLSSGTMNFRATAMGLCDSGWIGVGYKLLGNGKRQICSIHIAKDMPDLRALFVPPNDLEYRTLFN